MDNLRDSMVFMAFAGIFINYADSSKGFDKGFNGALAVGMFIVGMIYLWMYAKEKPKRRVLLQKRL